LAPERVGEDLKALEHDTKIAFSYAQRMVAHRTPIDALEITVGDINAAMDAIEAAFKKYYLIFTGTSLIQAAAAIQYDWTEPFSLPWQPRQPESE
jgi:hypothetical protein